MPKGTWDKVPPFLNVVDISSDPRSDRGKLWLLFSDGTIHGVDDPTASHLASQSASAPRTMKMITTGPWQWLWAVDSENFIWHFDGSGWTWTSPHQVLGGRAVSGIAVTESEVRIADDVGAQYTSYDWGSSYVDTNTWIPISKMASSGSNVLGLTRGAGWLNAWRSNGDQPLGGYWEPRNAEVGGFIDLAWGPNSGWLVHSDGRCFTTHDEGATYEPAPSLPDSQALAIAVGGSESSVWVTSAVGAVYRWMPAKPTYCPQDLVPVEIKPLASQIHPTAFGTSSSTRRSAKSVISYKVYNENMVVSTAAPPPAGAFATTDDVIREIVEIFRSWEVALNGRIKFTRYIDESQFPFDLEISFDTVSPLSEHRFGPGGTVAGFAGGHRVVLDQDDCRTAANLRSFLLHEVGHFLGLQHSDNPNSVMYPWVPPLAVVDLDSAEAARLLYGWHDEVTLSDRGSTSIPALAGYRKSQAFGYYEGRIRMVWKGVVSDDTLWESELIDNKWTPQHHLSQFETVSGPGMVSTQSGLLLAWRNSGSTPEKRAISFSTYDLDEESWSGYLTLRDRQSLQRPALGLLQGRVIMAWRGGDGDNRIWYSEYTKSGPVHGWTRQMLAGSDFRSNDGPALVPLGAQLLMIWAHADDGLMRFSTLTAVPGAVWSQPQVVTYPNLILAAAGAPNLAPIDWRTIPCAGPPTGISRANKILLVWKAESGESPMLCTLFDGMHANAPVDIPDSSTTTNGAGLGSFDESSGFTHLVWKSGAKRVLHWRALTEARTPPPT